MAGSTPDAPLRVLVTRPPGQEGGLCNSLEQAGYAAFHQPLLELQALERLPEGQRQHVIDLDLYQHVIFISGNAVRYGMARIEDFWPQLPLGITWYGVGSSTARQLEQFGLQPLSPGSDMTSEGLLALPQLRAVGDQRVLIIKGEGGRSTLQETLRSRGARVDLLECYRRRRPRLGPGELAARLIDWRIDVVLISSGEGLENFVALLSAEETTKFRNVCLVVPSARVAQRAGTAGFALVVTAANASDTAMLQALEEWHNASGE